MQKTKSSMIISLLIPFVSRLVHLTLFSQLGHAFEGEYCLFIFFFFFFFIIPSRLVNKKGS